MKKIFLLLAIIFMLTAAVGCGSAETQSMADLPDITTSDADNQTEEISLPPEGIDCLAVANEYALAFQQLYRNYFNAETRELSIEVSNDLSLSIYDGYGYTFVPVIDDEIKCCDDLKKILTERCTDEFAQKLMDKVVYRDFDGKLYKAHEIGQIDAGRWQFGCYIDECVLDGNVMTVRFINIGYENENFDIDPNDYERLDPYDEPFEMTLVWENERWLISDISGYSYCSYIAFAYREDITRSMHEAKTNCESQDETALITGTQTEEISLPPEVTDCLAVANEYALAFQLLYRNYLQTKESELSFKVSSDISLMVNDDHGIGFLPAVDDEIRCCADLKKLLTEYCTDEFAQKLLDEAAYRDFDGKLYKSLEKGVVDAGRWQFGCYIDECVLDGNKMTVGFINIGTENENFDIDLERYDMMSIHDQPFEMTLVWKNEHWLISDISSGYDSYVAFSYREDITKSMHEAN